MLSFRFWETEDIMNSVWIYLGISSWSAIKCPNIKSGFGKTVIFTFKAKGFSKEMLAPMRRFEVENKVANHPHLATK